jgi:tripartite-type tricarboxylate transporter receptor subunit TctC
VLVIKSPIALIAGIDAPVKNFQAMVDYAKTNPGKLGQAGVGSMGHVAFELLQQKAGIRLNAVPYKGGPSMMTDLLGGHLPVASDLLSNSIRLASEKKVRLLAVATARRMSDLPEVPTVQELIHAPFEAAAWFAILTRTGTPADILQKINAVTNRYLESAKGRELVARQAVEAGGGTPADAAAFVKLELEKWEPVIKTANIALD